jgi:hypothetical protein
MLGKGSERTHGSGWERLGQLAEADAVGTFELAELLVERAWLRKTRTYRTNASRRLCEPRSPGGDITISQRTAPSYPQDR